jgi:conserved oligomeric Golgi complex subunit 8
VLPTLRPQDGKQQAGARDGAALHSWVQHRVACYVGALRRHLPNVTEGGALASVLEHCTYCGASLSRVGLDFRVRGRSLFGDWLPAACSRFAE